MGITWYLGLFGVFFFTTFSEGGGARDMGNTFRITQDTFRSFLCVCVCVCVLKCAGPRKI